MEDTGAAQDTGASGQDTGTQAGEVTDYAGYQTPEELVQAHTEANSRMETLQKQVSDLERIKGNNSGMISQLNEKIAMLTGQIEGMRASMPQGQPGPTLDQIASDLQDGTIDEAQALKLASQITEQQVTTKLGQQFKQEMQREINAFREQTAREKYVQDFVNKNPGYLEAFNSGKLDEWLTVGPNGEKSGGEQAWKEYQLQTTRAELAALKKKAEDAQQAAEKAGIDKGLQLSQSKTAAGKVLNGKGGQFSQVTGQYDLNDPKQRLNAGSALLAKMRSG